MHVNKKVARQYQLSINSYSPEYRACVDSFLLIKEKGPYVRKGDEKLKVILQENSNNQFLLKNHLFMRRNVTKAKQNCPEACFEYGKEQSQ
ncbi:hypothetical protein M9Y10_014345 [Tritrichomonas musculus]|uniref:Uncharacterized protein n=1 Tax=Tritrichomonas musculus TaxID=1915356 RepID=A0ABR2KZ99_9EUKA